MNTNDEQAPYGMTREQVLDKWLDDTSGICSSVSGFLASGNVKIRFPYIQTNGGVCSMDFSREEVIQRMIEKAVEKEEYERAAAFQKMLTCP